MADTFTGGAGYLPRPASPTGGAAFGQKPPRPRKPQPVGPPKGRPQKTTTGPAPQAPGQVIGGGTAFGAQAGRVAGRQAPTKPGGQGAPAGGGYGSQPIMPGSTLTNNDLNQLTDAAVGQRYGYADQQLAQAFQQSQALLSNQPHWYDDYLRTQQNLGFADAAAWQNATNQIAGLGSTMAAGAAQAAQADQQAMTADAAIRGATVDPQAAVRAQQAASINSQAMADAAALATTLGANSGSYFRSQYGIGARDKIAAQDRELAYVRHSLDPQAQQLAREKGDFAVTYGQDVRDRESDRMLEQQVLLGETLQAQSAAAAAKRQEREEFLAEMGISWKRWQAMSPKQRRTYLRKLADAKKGTPKEDKPETPSDIADPPDGYPGSEADWNTMSLQERQRWIKQNKKDDKEKPKPTSGPGSLTQTQESNLVSQINKVAGVFNMGVWPSGPGMGKPASLDQLKRYFQIRGTDPRVIHVAESLWRNKEQGRSGTIGPFGAQQAHDLGIHTNGRWKVYRPKKGR